MDELRKKRKFNFYSNINSSLKKNNVINTSTLRD